MSQARGTQVMEPVRAAGRIAEHGNEAPAHPRHHRSSASSLDSPLARGRMSTGISRSASPLLAGAGAPAPPEPRSCRGPCLALSGPRADPAAHSRMGGLFSSRLACRTPSPCAGCRAAPTSRGRPARGRSGSTARRPAGARSCSGSGPSEPSPDRRAGLRIDRRGRCRGWRQLRRRKRGATRRESHIVAAAARTSFGGRVLEHLGEEDR